MQTRYWALKLIATINVFVGWLIIIVAILVGFVTLLTALGAADVSALVRAASVLMPLYGLLFGVGFVSVGELIRLAIDLADSTRQMALDVRTLRDQGVKELREQDVAQ